MRSYAKWGSHLEPLSTKIAIIGPCGAGKSTCAKALAKKYNLKYTALDDLAYDKNWERKCVDEFRALVDTLTKEERWIIDGNWSVVRDLVWQRAETLIWLDFPLRVTFLRVFRRCFHLWRNKVEICNGNIVTLKREFFSRKSLLLYSLRSYHSKRNLYKIATASPEYKHLILHRIRSPKELKAWLQKLGYEG